MRVTPFTAVRGLIATLVGVLLSALVLLASPFIIVVMVFAMSVCILQSDSWRESLWKFRWVWSDAYGILTDAFRSIRSCWFAKEES